MIQEQNIPMMLKRYRVSNLKMMAKTKRIRRKSKTDRMKTGIKPVNPQTVLRIRELTLIKWIN